jgi:hypothetical protein
MEDPTKMADLTTSSRAEMVGSCFVEIIDAQLARYECEPGHLMPLIC